MPILYGPFRASLRNNAGPAGTTGTLVALKQTWNFAFHASRKLAPRSQGGVSFIAMSAKFRTIHSVLVAVMGAMLVWTMPALPADADDDAMILVAQPQLRDALYGSTIAPGETHA